MDFGPTLAAEKLSEHGLHFGVETVRRWMLVDGRHPWPQRRERRLIRKLKSRPLAGAFQNWLRAKLGLISQKGKLAEAIRYALSRWDGLTHFIDDGRIQLDNNAVERAIRPIALNRKNALFAGSDGGAEHWAVIASLIETCKLNDVDPLAYFTDVLNSIINGHQNSQIDQLLPWAYKRQDLKAVARKRRLRRLAMV